MKNSVLEDKVRERKLLDALFDDEMMSWSKGILERYNRLMAYYRCAIMEVETKFNVLNEEFSLRYDRNPISGIKSRLKKLDSIKEKLERRDLPFTLETVEEHIHDVAGVRVVCSFVDDVYLLADALPPSWIFPVPCSFHRMPDVLPPVPSMKGWLYSLHTAAVNLRLLHNSLYS